MSSTDGLDTRLSEPAPAIGPDSTVTHGLLGTVNLSDSAGGDPPVWRAPYVRQAGPRHLAFAGRVGSRIDDNGLAALLLNGDAETVAATLRRLRGPFAFARWDTQARELILARDHFGQQPLFYSPSPGGAISFSDRIGPLLDAGGPNRLDLDRMASFLLGRYADRSRTFFRAVRRVPAASMLTLATDWRNAVRYWQPRPAQTPQRQNDKDWASGFRERFEIGTQRSLADAHSPCVMLSGGMDSSAVAGVAARYAANLGSFTLLYSGERDERRWAEAVIAEKKLDPIFLDAYAVGPLDGLDALLSALEEPFENPGLTVGWAAAGTIAARGHDRILDGTLGDSVVSYDTMFLAVLARENPLRAMREAVLFHRHLYGEWSSPWHLVRSHVLRPFLRLGNPATETRFDPGCIHPDLRAGHREAAGHPDRGPESWEDLTHWHMAEATGAAAARSLEIRRRIYQAWGAEPGHVYADVDLVEYALALPWDQRVRHGLTRYVVRRALADDLPRVIRRRGGKWSPARAQCRRYAALPVGSFDEFIRAGPGPAEGLIDWRPVEAALDRLRSHPDSFESQMLIQLWLGYVVKRWMIMFRVCI
jgi:asparagine synthase (glutamine-hydrolysing)